MAQHKNHFREQIYLLLDQGYTDARKIHQRVQCGHICTVYKAMTEWNQMTQEEREEAVAKADMLLSRQPQEKQAGRDPEARKEEGGFRTPYRIPKNRIYISHY